MLVEDGQRSEDTARTLDVLSSNLAAGHVESLIWEASTGSFECATECFLICAAVPVNLGGQKT
jgi:hypothetical protein